MFAAVQLFFSTSSLQPHPGNGAAHSGSPHINEHNQDNTPEACSGAILESIRLTVNTNLHSGVVAKISS